MASSSLHPPAIVHVASTLSESNHHNHHPVAGVHARPRTPTSNHEDHDNDDDAGTAWTASPLSSCPNSPPVTPTHGAQDDGDDDSSSNQYQEQPTAIFTNAPPRHAALASAFPLCRQDSTQLGRESRLSRLKAVHQSRFLQLEEKKSADDSGAADNHPATASGDADADLMYNNSNSYYYYTGREEALSSFAATNDSQQQQREAEAAAAENDHSMLPSTSERSRLTVRMRQNLSSWEGGIEVQEEQTFSDGGGVVYSVTSFLDGRGDDDEEPQDPGEIPLQHQRPEEGAAGAEAMEVQLQQQQDVQDDHSIPMDESVGEESVPMDEKRVAQVPSLLQSSSSHSERHPESVAAMQPRVFSDDECMVPLDEMHDVVGSATAEVALRATAKHQQQSVEVQPRVFNNDDSVVPLDEMHDMVDPAAVKVAPQATRRQEQQSVTVQPRVFKNDDNVVPLDEIHGGRGSVAERASTMLSPNEMSDERDSAVAPLAATRVAVAPLRKRYDEMTSAVAPQADTTYSSRMQQQSQPHQVINLVDHDVPLDEMEEDYEERPPPPPSRSLIHHSNSAIADIPMDEIDGDEFMSPPPPPPQDNRGLYLQQHQDELLKSPRNYEHPHSRTIAAGAEQWRSIPDVATAPTDELVMRANSFESTGMVSFASNVFAQENPSFDELQAMDDMIPWSMAANSPALHDSKRTAELLSPPRTTSKRPGGTSTPPVRIAPIVATSPKLQKPLHQSSYRTSGPHSPVQSITAPTRQFSSDDFSVEQNTTTSLQEQKQQHNSSHHQSFQYPTVTTTQSFANAMCTESDGFPLDESVEVIPDEASVEVIHCGPEDYGESDDSSSQQDHFQSNSRLPPSQTKANFPKLDASARANDLTEATMSEEEHEVSVDRASSSFGIIQQQRIDSESDDSPSEDYFGPLPDLEQRRPLVQQHEDLSSSDETPVTSNSPSGFTRSRRSGGSHNEWANMNQDYYQKHPRGQRRKRLRKKLLKRRAAMSKTKKNPSGEPQAMLPALVVDQEQLRAIGVKAMMSVCNGIGSLFLTTASSSNDTKQLQQSPKPRRSKSYQRLTPERPSPKQTSARKSPKSLSKSVSPPKKKPTLENDRRNALSVTSVKVESAERTGAAVFAEAFEQSLQAEHVSNKVKKRPEDVKVKKSDSETKAERSLSAPRERQSRSLERQQKPAMNDRKLRQSAPPSPRGRPSLSPERQTQQWQDEEMDEPDLMTRQSTLSSRQQRESQNVERRTPLVMNEPASKQVDVTEKTVESDPTEQFSKNVQRQGDLKKAQWASSNRRKKNHSVTRHDYSEGWQVETKVIGSRRSLGAKQGETPPLLESAPVAARHIVEEKKQSLETEACDERKQPTETDTFGTTILETADWSLAREIEKSSASATPRQSVAERIARMRRSREEQGIENDGDVTTTASTVGEPIPSVEVDPVVRKDAPAPTVTTPEPPSPAPEATSSEKWLEAVREIALKSRGNYMASATENANTSVALPATPRKEIVEASLHSVELTPISEPPALRRVNLSLNLDESIGVEDQAATANAPNDDEGLITTENIETCSQGLLLIDQSPEKDESPPSDPSELHIDDNEPPSLSRSTVKANNVVDDGDGDIDPSTLHPDAEEIEIEIQVPEEESEPPSFNRPTVDSITAVQAPQSIMEESALSQSDRPPLIDEDNTEAEKSPSVIPEQTNRIVPSPVLQAVWPAESQPASPEATKQSQPKPEVISLGEDIGSKSDGNNSSEAEEVKEPFTAEKTNWVAAEAEVDDLNHPSEIRECASALPAESNDAIPSTGMPRIEQDAAKNQSEASCSDRPSFKDGDNSNKERMASGSVVALAVGSHDEISSTNMPEIAEDDKTDNWYSRYSQSVHDAGTEISTAMDGQSGTITAAEKCGVVEESTTSQVSQDGNADSDENATGLLQKTPSPVAICKSSAVFDDYNAGGALAQLDLIENVEAQNESESDQFGEYNLASAPPREPSSQQASPMSEFLASRMNEANEDCRSEASGSESDYSSTEKLMSQLDDMVKDLDGLVGSRRIERSFTAESFSTGLSAFDSPSEKAPSSDLKALVGTENPDYVSDAMPTLIKSLNNDMGIPKGDMMVSLLNNNLSEPGCWATRVDEAIWRCRTMRRNFSSRWQEKKASRKPKKRLSVCIDVDEVRVVGGIDKLANTQETALDYLEYDDLDDALTLYESVNFSCESFVEEMDEEQAEKCKPCVASTLHNLGIIYMLRGDFDEALPCFEQATQLLAEYHGPGHVDHIASLVKLAMCRFAMEDYTEAYSDLKDSLSLSRGMTRSLSDYRQLAEILNNLGCLSYMGGELEKAMLFLREANKIQAVASENSLYIGSKFSSQSVSLNASITNGNIGFISLLLQDVTESVTILESAVLEQQLLLRDAHVTLVRTMEHLVVANLFAGRKRHALQLLRRLYHLQLDAYGRLDSRTISTRNKIEMLEEEDQAIDEPVAVDPAIQEIPVIDESNDGGKLNSSIFKALRRRQQKAKKSRKSYKKSDYFV